MKVTIKNIETKEVTTLDEEQTIMYSEGTLGMDTISGVSTSDENWDSLVEEIWEKKQPIKYNEELTREEVVSMIGEELVVEAENDNCDYTNAVGQNGENGYIGFSGFSSKMTDPNDSDYEIRVEVFYAVKNEDHENNCEDLGGVDWVGSIDHYKILD